MQLGTAQVRVGVELGTPEAVKHAVAEGAWIGVLSRLCLAWEFHDGRLREVKVRGLRIARVQYLTRDVTLTKRFRVWVTLRDLNGRRVRDAVVRVGPVAGARYTVAGAAATYTDRNGQARLVLTATSSMLGRLVMLQIAARTPSVRAATVGTVRLPRVAPR